MPVAQINGAHLNYTILGDSGPMIALSPGGRRGFDELVPLAEKVARAGYRILLHDRRNCGRSDVWVEGDIGENQLWVEDLHALLKRHDALPAFVGGGSSGCRLSMLLALRYPRDVRGLLLWRVTGGPFAAKRLPQVYYTQFIEAARQGGMDAVCAMEHWRDRIAANPRNGDYLRRMDPGRFIAQMEKWRTMFQQDADNPILGVSAVEAGAIRVPTLIIPGNDWTHSSVSGKEAHHLISGSELHLLPVEDQEVDLVPPEGWKMHEDEIARTFVDFLNRARAKAAA